VSGVGLGWVPLLALVECGSAQHAPRCFRAHSATPLQAARCMPTRCKPTCCKPTRCKPTRWTLQAVLCMPPCLAQGCVAAQCCVFAPSVPSTSPSLFATVAPRSTVFNDDPTRSLVLSASVLGEFFNGVCARACVCCCGTLAVCASRLPLRLLQHLLALGIAALTAVAFVCRLILLGCPVLARAGLQRVQAFLKRAGTWWW
jgi:hypothetical protein